MILRRALAPALICAARPGGLAPAGRCGAGRPAHMGRAHHAGADLVRPGRDARHDHALHGALRAPRRHGEAHADGSRRRRAWRSRGPWPRTGSRTSSSCARTPASTTARRSPREGREVLLRALPRHRRARASRISVAAVETPDPGRVRFRLKQPWPDFLTFYSSATGAGWIVPKKYVEQRGRRTASRRRPSARGLTSSSPSRRAWSWSWRRSTSTGGRRPRVKRLVLRVIPDESTRLAALKRGEVDSGLLDSRRAGRGAPAHAGPRAEARRHPGHLLALLPRPVGSQVPVA